MEASDGDLWRDAYGRLRTSFVRLANGALTTDVPPHSTHANCARRRHCSRRSLWTGASRPTHSYCISPLTSTGGRPVAGLLTRVDTRTCWCLSVEFRQAESTRTSSHHHSGDCPAATATAGSRQIQSAGVTTCAPAMGERSCDYAATILRYVSLFTNTAPGHRLISAVECALMANS